LAEITQSLNLGSSSHSGSSKSKKGKQKSSRFKRQAVSRVQVDLLMGGSQLDPSLFSVKSKPAVGNRRSSYDHDIDYYPYPYDDESPKEHFDYDFYDYPVDNDFTRPFDSSFTEEMNFMDNYHGEKPAVQRTWLDNIMNYRDKMFEEMESNPKEMMVTISSNIAADAPKSTTETDTIEFEDDVEVTSATDPGLLGNLNSKLDKNIMTKLRQIRQEMRNAKQKQAQVNDDEKIEVNQRNLTILEIPKRNLMNIDNIENNDSMNKARKIMQGMMKKAIAVKNMNATENQNTTMTKNGKNIPKARVVVPAEAYLNPQSSFKDHSTYYEDV
jgi:hypothetical protein